jgi:hypothetical protein
VRTDAERMDWLQANGDLVKWEPDANDGAGAWTAWLDVGRWTKKSIDVPLRAAIDAAMDADVRPATGEG